VYRSWGNKPWPRAKLEIGFGDDSTTSKITVPRETSCIIPQQKIFILFPRENFDAPGTLSFFAFALPCGPAPPTRKTFFSAGGDCLGGPSFGGLGPLKGLKDMTTAYDKRCTIILSLKIYEMFGD
jgi:hypothetical protein